MDRELTDITLVVDRSGSMESIREDAEGGINAFLRKQAEQPGNAMLTLVQFDTDYEFAHQGVSIGSVPSYQLVPRGSTALLDAVGRAITETGMRLASMPESNRPGLVVFVVMTDGLENSSHEYTLERVREMIEHQQSKYNWQFTFLGADQDAFASGGAMGFAAAGTANVAKAKVGTAYRATSDKVARMRRAASTGEEICNSFTQSERRQME